MDNDTYEFENYFELRHAPHRWAGHDLVHAPTEEVGFPLVVGLITTPLAVWLLAGLITHFQLSSLLAVLEAAVGCLFAYIAWGAWGDLWSAIRFNRRSYRIVYGLEGVRIESDQGVEELSFAEAIEHPLTREPQLTKLMRVRAHFPNLAARADERVILEVLSMVPPDPAESSKQGWVMLRDDERLVWITSEEEAVDAAQVARVYAIPMGYNHSTKAYEPELNRLPRLVSPR